MKKSVTSGKPRGRPAGSKNKTSSPVAEGSFDQMNRLSHHLAFLVNTAAVVGANESAFATALATECEETLAALSAARKAIFPNVGSQVMAKPETLGEFIAKGTATPDVTPEAVQ